MEVPVTGLVLHSDDSNSSSNHSHHLYLATWNDLPVSVHMHHFSGATSFDVGMITNHYAGKTEPAPHTHRYFSVTTFNDGHKHEIQGMTGPAIPLPNGGGHHHKFKGVTTLNGATLILTNTAAAQFTIFLLALCFVELAFCLLIATKYILL
ncbi:YmaF family protein [Domibacillus sp. A3M-37]|uniref:YmaF family protein n=1 Tax=Domibacillus sp. A3M-37 TaxID=2962037 RepID=UPI002810B633|nr:YmaF family protein [Domibacillus sp. A3M-37]